MGSSATRVLRRTVIPFVLVGVIGFIVDAGTLHIIVALSGLPPLAARFFSFLLAAYTTWRLNRGFTFSDRSVGQGSLGEWLRYLSASSVGAAVNYGVFAALVITLPLLANVQTYGVALGSLAGMAVNFSLYRLVVFPGRS